MFSRQDMIELLIDVLEGNDVKADIAYALGEIGDPRAIDPLIEALDHEDGEVSRNSIFALGKLRDKRATFALIEKLNNPDDAVRWGVVRALGQLEDPRSIDALIRALKDKAQRVRVRAAEAVGMLKDPKSLRPLTEAATMDPDKLVQLWANFALIKLGQSEKLNFILKSLQDRDPVVRFNAAGALGKVGLNSSVPYLLRASVDPDKRVRYRVALSLGQIGDADALETLIKMLADEDDQVRYFSAEALGKIKDFKAFPYLMKSLDDHSPQVRFFAAKALTNFDQKQVLPVLQKALTKEPELWLKESIRDLIDMIEKQQVLRVSVEEILNKFYETTKKEKYIETVGRRKTSTARVRLVESPKNHISINEKSENDYFPVEKLRLIVREPLTTAKITQKFKVSAIVKGGGISSQAEAVRHAISRALVKYDRDLRKTLKQAGFLKRDPRMKERRKFGLKKARKAPQWSKR